MDCGIGDRAHPGYPPPAKDKLIPMSDTKRGDFITLAGSVAVAGALRSDAARLPHLWMALATVLGVSSAAAQVYPSRTVQIVVPLPPGATAGILPRLIAGN